MHSCAHKKELAVEHLTPVGAEDTHLIHMEGYIKADVIFVPLLHVLP